MKQTMKTKGYCKNPEHTGKCIDCNESGMIHFEKEKKEIYLDIQDKTEEDSFMW